MKTLSQIAIISVQRKKKENITDMNPVYSDPIPLREKCFKEKNCKEIWILLICFLVGNGDRSSYPKTILSIL